MLVIVAYQLILNFHPHHRRNSLTQSVTDIMRRIADMWRPLSDEQKAPWVALSSQDKARYDQEMANYDGPLRVPNKRAKKDPDAPKRAMPAFLFYSQENRPKIKVGYHIFVPGQRQCFHSLPSSGRGVAIRPVRSINRAILVCAFVKGSRRQLEEHW